MKAGRVNHMRTFPECPWPAGQSNLIHAACSSHTQQRQAACIPHAAPDGPHTCLMHTVELLAGVHAGGLLGETMLLPSSTMQHW